MLRTPPPLSSERGVLQVAYGGVFAVWVFVFIAFHDVLMMWAGVSIAFHGASATWVRVFIVFRDVLMSLLRVSIALCDVLAIWARASIAFSGFFAFPAFVFIA